MDFVMGMGGAISNGDGCMYPVEEVCGLLDGDD